MYSLILWIITNEALSILFYSIYYRQGVEIKIKWNKMINPANSSICHLKSKLILTLILFEKINKQKQTKNAKLSLYTFVAWTNFGIPL